jgi:hypothetical protein
MVEMGCRLAKPMLSVVETPSQCSFVTTQRTSDPEVLVMLHHKQHMCHQQRRAFFVASTPAAAAAECHTFVCCHLAAFNQLKTPVEKSDAWRYHVLCGHGGIYTDTDTVCARPFSEWTNFNSTPEPGLIVGIEDRFYTQEVRAASGCSSTAGVIDA